MRLLKESFTVFIKYRNIGFRSFCFLIYNSSPIIILRNLFNRCMKDYWCIHSEYFRKEIGKVCVISYLLIPEVILLLKEKSINMCCFVGNWPYKGWCHLKSVDSVNKIL